MNRSAVERWRTVVEGEAAYASALAQLTPDEMRDVLFDALGTMTGCRAALRVLRDSPLDLIESVFPALEQLLLVSHSMLAEAQRIVRTLPENRLIELLGGLTNRVIGDDSADYEAYRRLAELLRSVDQRPLLQRLVKSAAGSGDPDVREVAVDFNDGHQ